MASRLRKAAKVGLAAVGVAGGVAAFTILYTNKNQVSNGSRCFLNYFLMLGTDQCCGAGSILTRLRFMRSALAKRSFSVRLHNTGADKYFTLLSVCLLPTNFLRSV